MNYTVEQESKDSFIVRDPWNKVVGTFLTPEDAARFVRAMGAVK